MDKLSLIKRNLQEIVGEKELVNSINEGKSLTVYIGTAITGRPHFGYFVWARKITDFLNAGLNVKILLADLHGALDNTPWDVLEKRYKYYSEVIPFMIKSLGGDLTKLELVRGSSFQKSGDYIEDLLKLSTLTSIHDAKKAGSEVVKFGDNPKLSGLIYPLMQALDEEYLGVDIQFGGIDQRKILMYAREYLPKMGYKSRINLMTPLIPGLTGGKMSASQINSKIDLIDSPKIIKKKINKAFCPETVEDNPILAYLKNVLMVDKPLHIDRPDKFGGPLNFETYESVEKAYVEGKLHPADLKLGVSGMVINLLEPFEKFIDLAKECYENQE